MVEDEAFIHSLPSEVLEYIIGLVSPYNDLQSCKLVCKKWLEVVQEVVNKHQMRFLSSISNNNIHWETLPSSHDLFTTISRRYSHAACYYDNYMYVFGGCTSTNTTFNDLWKLNLSSRTWVRPLPTGSYPSPKACATLVCYKDSLILYGGWTQSSSSPLHQVCQLFNELNIYRLKTNKWDYEYTHPAPPSAAGHSATVHGHHMIVFGGIRRQLSLGQPSQEILCYDLENNSWFQKEIEEPKPQGRYGQTQIALNEHNLLVIGGCGGPNSVFNDVWLLNMEGPRWRWRELTVEDQEHGASHMWCSPGCKVEDKVVFLCRRPNAQQASSPHPAYASHYNMSAQIRGRSVWVPPVENSADRPNNRVPEEKNVNGNGSGDLNLRRQEVEPKEPVRIHPRPGTRPSVRPNAMKNRGKQLEALKQMEERIQRLQGNARDIPKVKVPSGSQSSMSLCLLDISEALSKYRVRWLPPNESFTNGRGSPEEAVLYSIVHGRGELIVFGGVQKFIATQATTNSPGGPKIVSNAVYFIQAPKSII
ncbi:F-box only protein 42-like [Daphnia carinata]|uniref:F-box only protein 42-like n=1 Tax=Daphnia carinata TaxID=120202 RepID=UPI00257D5223|nr:F-box only protein 42-like [Daphnia carinata]